MPDGVLQLTAGVDVQKDRLGDVIRGWGLRPESWLIDHGEIWGDPVSAYRCLEGPPVRQHVR